MLFSCTYNALFILTHTLRNMLGTSLVLFFPTEGGLAVVTGLCLLVLLSDVSEVSYDRV